LKKALSDEYTPKTGSGRHKINQKLSDMCNKPCVMSAKGTPGKASNPKEFNTILKAAFKLFKINDVNH
jgi:hypothetical protein